MRLKDTSLYQNFRRIRIRIKYGLNRQQARLPWIGEALVRRWHVRRYEKAMGATPRLNPPVTFSEHLIHRILFDRDPRLKIVSDKLAVRSLIEERVGPDYVVPLLGAWDDAAHIAWETLPTSYVLKPNHGSGMVSVVHDASSVDRQKLRAEARSWLGTDYYDVAREWGYQSLPRRILAETLLTGLDGAPPPEVQVMTFHGKAVLMRVLTGRKGKGTRLANWFDVNGVEQNLRSKDIAIGSYRLSRDTARLLASLAGRAAVGFDHLRVDFYLTDSGPRIGELTSYHASGIVEWNDLTYDEMLGKCWRDPSEASRRAQGEPFLFDHAH